MFTMDIDIETLIEETLEHEPVEEELEQDNDVHTRLERYEEALKENARHSAATAKEIYEVFLQCPGPRPSILNNATNMTSSPSMQIDRSRISVVQNAQQFGLPSIPLDVFFEIASNLHPLELLRCSRTSKTLRSMLLSLRSRSLWQRALEAIPQLPPCPVDMSEVFFTALLFDDYCFACGAECAHAVDYALRVRLCHPCWQENVCEGTTALDNVPRAVQDLVMMLIPCETSIDPQNDSIYFSASRLQPHRHILQDFYSKGELDAVLRSIWPPPKASTFTLSKPLLIERTKYVLRRQAHAFTLHLWEARVRERRAGGSVIRLPGHQLALLRAQCVSYELADTSVDGPEAELDAIPDNIVFQLQKDYVERVRRRDTVYEERLQTRYTQLTSFYDELLKGPWSELDQRLFPNKHDGARLLSGIAAFDDARGTVSRRTFYDYATLHELYSDIGFYRRDYAQHLASLVTSGIEAELGSESARQLTDRSYIDILSMPCALFTCTVCFEEPLAYPDIHAHWREEHPDISVWRKSDLLFLQSSKVGKDICERVDFWPQGLAVGQVIL
ncbi:hypothetical protein L227DRAFT_191411 [Lentinus tigrinus ALCF2SS1-6]|uniref:F-box domain-containing protein n=1 Tax=Lentinus tigrinus ALCF2SS1-6 TaxID=1328759 RepID=A0A5C2S3M5_9APHY|nr:hypothetical protein L227DRAFT_191411 [Lentinus tigrinus ALCF2SS1-6]